MRITDLLFIASLAPAVFADVQITTPAPGADAKVGTMQIAWKDSGTAPPLSQLSTYTIDLIVGGNEIGTDAAALTTLVAQGKFTPGDSITAPVAATLAGSTPNGFYLRITSTVTTGGTVINYSQRFNIPGMTGTTPAQFVAGASAVSGVADVPLTNNGAAPAAAAPAAAAPGAGAPVDAADFSIAYTLQTGLTRYAPMQGVPPTKITLKDYTPMYATSSRTTATTWMPKPTAQTTITQSQTFSVSPIENTAAAQAEPTNDMQKFLARWRD